MFVYVNLESLAIPFILPVRDAVSHVVKERAAAQIKVRDQHPAQMAQMSNSIAARSQRHEKLDGAHDRHIRTHRDGHRQRNQPDLAIGKEDRVGHEYAENRAGSADRGDIRGRVSPELWDQFDDHLDQAGAHSTDDKKIQEAALAPNYFEIAAEHPEHQHVDQNVPE